MALIFEQKNLMRLATVSVLAISLGVLGAFETKPAFSLTAKDGKPVQAEPDQKDKADEGKGLQGRQFESAREGSMTVETMRDIVKRLDEKVKELRPGTFSMVINDFEVLLVTANQANRMRIMVRVRSAENLTKEELLRISQANLDAALDARYAIGRGVLWATYIHPLSSLPPLQFIEAIGSTVNLAASYGTSYSSGQLIYGGGDSRGIIGRKLIDQLIKKGRPI